MFHEADNCRANEDEHGKRKGHSDVACHSEGVGQHPEHVSAEDEEEKGVDEGKVWKRSFSGILLHHAENEFIGKFCKRLESTGDEGASAHRGREEEIGGKRDDDHPCRRVGERDIDAANLDGHECLDFKLAHGIDLESGSSMRRSDEHLRVVLLGVDGFAGAHNVHDSSDDSKRYERKKHPRLRPEPFIHCPAKEPGNTHGDEHLNSHAHGDSSCSVMLRTRSVAWSLIVALARSRFLKFSGEVS